jgi:hypothetical protein
LRRLASLAALAAILAACSNSDPVKRPNPPPVVSTTTINFSTYLGDDLADAVEDVAIDGAGNTYVVGGALSTDLLPGAPTRAHAGAEDAFAAKLDATGQVVWWTYVGGAGPDRAYAVDLAPNGDVVIGGGAAAGFPVTGGALLTQFQGGAGACDPTQPTSGTGNVCTPSTANPARDGFVARLAAADGDIVWATYFGSGRFEADTDTNATDAVTDFNDDLDPLTSVVHDVAVDPGTGDIYLTFSVRAPSTFFPDPDPDIDPNTAGDQDGPLEPAVVRNLPAVILAALQFGDRPELPGMDNALSTGSIDGMLARLAGNGASLAWATFVGGTGNEGTEAKVRVDSQGNPVVLFDTVSATRVDSQDPNTKEVIDTEPITLNGYDSTLNGRELYVAKFALNGPMLWATYVGGSDDESANNAGLALRADDAVLIATESSSANFAMTGAWDPTYNGGTGAAGFFTTDCAIVRVAPDGTAREAATYYGGASGDGCTGVAVDSSNRVYVAGGSSSLDLPIRSGPHQTTRPGPRSAFLAVFSADLGTLLYGGYFGGSGAGHANALVLRGDSAGSGQVAMGGEAEADYPLTPSPGSPARGSVTAPPAHGVISDLTLGF